MEGWETTRPRDILGREGPLSPGGVERGQQSPLARRQVSELTIGKDQKSPRWHAHGESTGPGCGHPCGVYEASLEATLGHYPVRRLCAVSRDSAQ